MAIDLVIIMSELSLKRQKIAEQIRRSEIQKYILSCRASLDAYNNPQGSPSTLTDQKLKAYEQQLEDQNYTTESLLQFLNKINAADLQIVDSAYLLVKLRRVLMHIQDESYLKNAAVIAKSICMKILSESRKNKLYLNKCFQQFFELVSEQKLGLYQIWSSIAILRNEIFFELSFNMFINFVKEYSKQIDEIISLILKTMLHFSAIFDTKSEIRLTICQQFQIVRIVNLIFQNYTLGNQDLKMAAKLLVNIVSQQKTPKIAEELIDFAAVMPILLQAIHEKAQKDYYCTQDTQEAVLELLAHAVTGSKNVVQAVLKAYPETIQLLRQKLPLRLSFNNVKTMRPVTWIHQNTNLTLRALLVLTNLAAFPELSFKFISSGVASQVIQLSAYPSDFVKGEVAIFLWNLIIETQEQMVEILCEKDVLWALKNGLEADSYPLGLEYSLKCMSSILAKSQHFPPNNLAWNYSTARIKKQIESNGYLLLIQRQILSSQEEISKQAINLMTVLKEVENQ